MMVDSVSELCDLCQEGSLNLRVRKSIYHLLSDQYCLFVGKCDYSVSSVRAFGSNCGAT